MIAKKLIRKLKRKNFSKIDLKSNLVKDNYAWLDWSQELKKIALFNSNLVVMQS